MKTQKALRLTSASTSTSLSTRLSARLSASRSMQAFTLIELMIVVSIIGILAAISIPAYQDYTARSKISEVINLAGAGKTILFEEYASSGFMPSSQPPIGTLVGDWLASFGMSRYVNDIPVYTGTALQAKILVTLNPAVGVSGGDKIEFIYTATPGALAMECSAIAAHNEVSGIGTATTVDARYLPGVCR